MGQELSLFEAKSLGKYLTQIFSFINGQYLAQIKIQIVKQIGCVDAALMSFYHSELQPCTVVKLSLILLLAAHCVLGILRLHNQMFGSNIAPKFLD